MPRQPRLDARLPAPEAQLMAGRPPASFNMSCMPGEIPKDSEAHFTGAWGIERRNIFKDDKDRKSFLDRLATILEETQTQCYVYPVKCLPYGILPFIFHWGEAIFNWGLGLDPESRPTRPSASLCLAGGRA